MTLAMRTMNKTDIPAVGTVLYNAFNTVAARYGHAPKFKDLKEGASWAWALLHHQPVRVFIAECEGRIAGLCCLNPRGAMGGVGPVAVDPAYQGRKIGTSLMTALLHHAQPIDNLRLVQEAYNTASFSLYYGLGFKPVACLLELSHSGDKAPPFETPASIKQLTIDDIDRLQHYDQPKSRSNRYVDFRYYLRWGKVFAFKNSTSYQGYLACLPGKNGVTLGPLLAESDHEAGALYQHALTAYRGKALRTRLMANELPLIEKLKACGFTLNAINNLMVRGKWRPGPFVEGFGLFPEGI